MREVHGPQSRSSQGGFGEDPHRDIASSMALASAQSAGRALAGPGCDTDHGVIALMLPVKVAHWAGKWLYRQQVAAARRIAV